LRERERGKEGRRTAALKAPSFVADILRGSLSWLLLLLFLLLFQSSSAHLFFFLTKKHAIYEIHGFLRRMGVGKKGHGNRREKSGLEGNFLFGRHSM
jgi:hypothetical protein